MVIITYVQNYAIDHYRVTESDLIIRERVNGSKGLVTRTAGARGMGNIIVFRTGQ